MKRYALLLLAMFVPFALYHCDPAGGDNGGITGPYVSQIASFCVSSGDLTGWQTDGECYSYTGNPDSLFNYIDGGSSTYTTNNLEKGVIQSLTDGNTGTISGIMAMDFKTNTNAVAMLNDMKQNYSPYGTHPDWNESQVITSEVLDGMMYMAVFEQYYFEFSVANIGDSTATHAVAKQLIDWYLAKIASVK